MELHLQLPDAAKYILCLSSSSSSFLTFDSRIILPWKSPGRAKQPFSLRFVKSEKKSLEKSKGLRREAKRDLSRILRTEAATKGIEKKANSAKSNRLWPKAVLEALDDSINNNHWESALKIFGLLRKQHWYQPRCQTYTKLLMMLAKCGQPKQASFLFEVMLSEGLKPTVDVYTSLVNAYGLSGLFDEAFHTVDDMKSVSDCRPDVVTYSTLINCCTKFHRFDLIDPLLTEMSYSGIQCSTVTYNTIINGYGKAEMFEQMEKALMDMIESGQCLPDVFTLNSIVWAYGNAGQIETMEKWYDEFQHMGIRPDIRTFNTLMRSYGKVGMFEKMVSVLEFMEKRFLSPTIVTFNIIIEMFGRNGNIKKMEYFFQKMKHRGMKPNSITYCSLVSVYNKAGLLDKVDSILRQADNSDIVLDTPFFNCVISAFGQVGNIKRMEEMFLIMKEKKCMPDKITFATMIQAYKVQGNLEAVREFEKEIFNGEKTQGSGLPCCLFGMKSSTPSKWEHGRGHRVVHIQVAHMPGRIECERAYDTGSIGYHFVRLEKFRMVVRVLQHTGNVQTWHTSPLNGLLHGQKAYTLHAGGVQVIKSQDVFGGVSVYSYIQLWRQETM